MITATSASMAVYIFMSTHVPNKRKKIFQFLSTLGFEIDTKIDKTRYIVFMLFKSPRSFLSTLTLLPKIRYIQTDKVSNEYISLEAEDILISATGKRGFVVAPTEPSLTPTDYTGTKLSVFSKLRLLQHPITPWRYWRRIFKCLIRKFYCKN